MKTNSLSVLYISLKKIHLDAARSLHQGLLIYTVSVSSEVILNINWWYLSKVYALITNNAC